MTPFIIYGLPRSRTAWLSMFLSYGDWNCHHERAMHMRSMADVVDLFSTPNTGTIETGAPYGRCLLKYFVPNLKEVVILRPVEDALNSLLKLDISEVATFDQQKLRKLMERGDRALKRIIKDPNVLAINYSDLDKEETCARIFEFCLPYKFDRDWWQYMKDKNIQLNYKLLLLYRLQNKGAIAAFKSLCKRELIKLCRSGELSIGRASYEHA